jgi:hypothetical protein
MLSCLREEGSPSFGSDPSRRQSSSSNISREEGNLFGKDISFGQLTITRDFREEGNMSSGNDSSLEQLLILRLSREERCLSPFPGKDFPLGRHIIRDTREFGSNCSFSKVLTIPSPPICKSDSAVRLFRPHPVTGGVVLNDSM